MPKLAIDIEARYAQAMDALDKLGRKADQQSKFMANAFKAVGTALTAAIGAGGLTAVNNIADAIASYQDLADRMGDTAVAISGLQDAADLSGVSLDEVSSASVRLTANLSKGEKGAKGTAEALSAIGISFEEFRRLSPVEQLERIAVQLAKFEDGASKTAVAVELFGRAGAQVIPFLNDLADTGGRNVRLTEEQIKAADDYSKSIARLSTEFDALVQSLTANVLPAFNDLLSGFNKLRQSGNGVFDSIIGSAFPKLAQSNLRDGINFWLAERDRLLKGIEDPPFIFRNDEKWKAQQRQLIENAGQELAKLIKQRDQLLGTPDNLLLPDLDDPLGGTRPGLGFTRTATGATKTARETEAEKITKWLEQQVQQAEKYNLLEQTAIKIAEAREQKAHGITDALEEQLLAQARLVVEQEKFVKAQEDEAAFEAFLAQLGETEERRIQSLADSYRDLIDPVEQYRAKLREIADLQEGGALNSNEAQSAREVVLAQIAALDAVEDSIKEIDEYARTAAQSMQQHFSDFLFDPFKEGLDGLAKNFARTVQRMAADALAANLMKALFGDYASSGNLGGFLGSLFSGGGGSSVNSTGSTLRAIEGGADAVYGSSFSSNAVPSGQEIKVNVNTTFAGPQTADPAYVQRQLKQTTREAVSEAMVRSRGF